MQRAEWDRQGQTDGAQITQLLAMATGDAWLRLSDALDSGLAAGMELHADRTEGWSKLDDAGRNAATAIARRWVMTAMPPDPTGPGEWPIEVAHALRGMWLVVEDAEALGAVGPAQWATWARILAWIAGVEADEGDTIRRDNLLGRAYLQAPEAVRMALREILDVEAATARANRDKHPARDREPFIAPMPVHRYARLVAIWDDALSEVLLEWQRAQPDDIGLGETIPFLAERGRHDAVELALDALGGSAVGIDAARRRVAAAVALLRCPGGAAFWPDVWIQWLRDEAFGRAIIVRVADGGSWQLPRVFAGLDADSLADLFLWVKARCPEAGNLADPYASVAEGILQHLSAAGTPEAVNALSRVSNDCPNDRRLAYSLAEAQRRLRANSWAPPSPKDLCGLLDDPHRHLAISDQGLAEVVIESIARAQDRISGTTPAVADLWDHPHNVDSREPKPEPYLSDWLARHLRDDLKAVLVNREVEITYGFRGAKKRREVDIHIDALAPTSDPMLPPRRLTVILENKGCWNAKVDTDIEDQLLNTYLAGTRAKAGIYVVFCFECARSGSKRRCPSCRRRSLDELREQLEKRARELTTNNVLLRSVVIEAGLT
jgi:hypothetical protein